MPVSRFSALLLFLAAATVQAGLSNQLSGHASPYLALHGDDPVKWQSWGSDVLELARKENKLIYISSGYFACHWCHVMQRESYQNSEVAGLLNRYFIPVKVDRELQPALDEHLIEFVKRTRGHAGWPLNVFLTPEGYPLVGFTYSPTDPFKRLLQRLEEAWKKDQAELQEIARAAAQPGSEAMLQQDQTRHRLEDLEIRLVAMALALGDEIEGGFGRQSRFPMTPQWSALLKLLEAKPDQTLQSLVELSLDQMATRGMRDHIGGGFFRYTVDPSWQVPHYEKMLYTQALMSQLYMQAARVLNRPDYLDVAKDTLDFTLREFAGREGGYIASLSAVDAEDVEGGGYLWSDQQLQVALSEEELVFARTRWGMQGRPATDGGYLPMDLEREARQALLGEPGNRKQAQRIRAKLLSARQPRAHPRDGKQLAAWNGLMLSALVEAAGTFDHQGYRKAAGQLRNYLVNRLWDGKRLLRARDGQEHLGSAALEDYVYVAAGLNAWADFSGTEADRELSRRLVADAWRRFYRPEGWQISDELLIPGIAREQALSDSALPSPAAMLIELSMKLDLPGPREKAKGALAMSQGDVGDQPIWYPGHIMALLSFGSDLPPVAETQVE